MHTHAQHAMQQEEKLRALRAQIVSLKAQITEAEGLASTDVRLM